MVQLISTNVERGTAQIVVQNGNESRTLHLVRTKTGTYKTVGGEEFNLGGLQPQLDTISRPTNLSKGTGKKKVSTPKKSREQKRAEKDVAKKPARNVRGQ